MNAALRRDFDNLRSPNRETSYKSYLRLMKATDRPVDWAYAVWDDLVEGLTDKDNHVRAIAAQLLANLPRSDPKGRILKDFPVLLSVTRDERFVTARHSLQAIWKVGLAGEKQQKLVMDGLARRFKECASEKNCTLIRYDIAKALRDLYDEVEDVKIRDLALKLIRSESDLKYRKKYEGVWRNA